MDIEIIHSMSRYPGADSALKGYGLKALERVCEHHRSQRGAAVKRVQKECMLWDFLLVKRVLARSGNPTLFSYFNCNCLILLHLLYLSVLVPFTVTAENEIIPMCHVVCFNWKGESLMQALIQTGVFGHFLSLLPRKSRGENSLLRLKGATA